MGCIIIQEVKGLTKKLFYCPGGTYAKFQFIVHIIYLLNIVVAWTISKTGSKRVNDKLYNYALCRKKTGLLTNIGATVSEHEDKEHNVV